MKLKIMRCTTIDTCSTFASLTILSNVSRGFAVVTEQLKEPLRTTVCVFYLILRALDIIEDDAILEESVKLEALMSFSSQLDGLSSPVRVVDRLKFDCNKFYAVLVDNFDKVLRVFNRCDSNHKKIIEDIVDEMAGGMIKYSAQSIETLTEYNEYCYYVAGIVGVGLTKLFQSNGDLAMERISDHHLRRLAVSAGVFLQKLNIIQDIYEDTARTFAAHVFFPKEIWIKYVKNVRDLIDKNYQRQAIGCLNCLINDAFQHLPESIEYISLVARQKSTFRFTAIPQCNAVATFDKLFNNPVVLSSRVTLDAAESVYIYENVTDMESCLTLMRSYLTRLSSRFVLLNASSASSEDTRNWILESVQFVRNYK